MQLTNVSGLSDREVGCKFHLSVARGVYAWEKIKKLFSKAPLMGTLISVLLLPGRQRPGYKKVFFEFTALPLPRLNGLLTS